MRSGSYLANLPKKRAKMNKIDAQAEFCNLPEWWDAGFTGKGVAVWNCEGFTEHGKTSRKRILQSAPDATVFSGHISSRTVNGQYKEVSVMLDDGTGKTTPVPLEEFLTENKIRVLNSSFSPTPFQHPGYKVHPYWKDIIEKYDLCVCCSSGNERKKDRKFDNDGECLWFVGAVNQGKDGLPVRAGYSNGGEGLDFTDFTGIWNGTSFSSPPARRKPPRFTRCSMPKLQVISPRPISRSRRRSLCCWTGTRRRSCRVISFRGRIEAILCKLTRVRHVGKYARQAFNL